MFVESFIVSIASEFIENNGEDAEAQEGMSGYKSGRIPGITEEYEKLQALCTGRKNFPFRPA